MVNYFNATKVLGVLLVLFVFSSFLPAHAQERKRYAVYLKDKNITGTNYNYELTKPEKFLTQRSLDRRKRQGIALNTRDLPVNMNTVKAIAETGARVWYVSRWLNAVLIEADENTLAKVKALPQVKPQVEMLSPIRSATATNPKPLTDATFKDRAGKEKKTFLAIDSIPMYGRGLNQAKMLNVPDMHKMGYRGQGMYIAVLDAGFENGDKVPFLQHLHDDGRILGTYNFVEGQENVYNTGNHGLEVLSCIGAYQAGKLIGTAPEASFYLFRTEDANTEYRVEEFYWLVAAEKADSLGVDVINSSLGYTEHDIDEQKYTYKDMNGKTAMVSRAATMAASVGILVVNSAGNEGWGDWKYIGAPADADSILSVGAVDASRKRAYFSSYGPTSDKRLKPNVSAQGSPAAVGKTGGAIGSNSGTSFSSPIMCGMVASFWQAFPQLTNIEIIEILQMAGSQVSKPDTVLGYGIPDFKLAYQIAQEKVKKAKTGFHVFPNPLPEGQAIRLAFSEYYVGKKLKLELTDMKGSTVESAHLDKATQHYEWNATARLPKGLYAVRVVEGKQVEIRRWYKE
jgi:hypothetical protein